MTVVMQLELILKYFKRAFKDFIIIHSAWVASSNYFYGWVAGWMGGWPGGVSETGNKAISASTEVEVELS